jgi:excisionase family DNA binding protein
VSEDQSVERLSVGEAAERLGVTRDAIHKRISRGSIRHEKGEDGRLYVSVDTTQTAADTSTDTSTDAREDPIDELRDRVRFLEGELERRGEEAARYQEIVGRLSIANAQLSARLPELEAAQDVEEPPTEATDEQQGRGPIPDHHTPSEAPESPQMHTVGGVPRDGDTDSPDHHTPSERERPWWRRLFEG